MTEIWTAQEALQTLIADTSHIQCPRRAWIDVRSEIEVLNEPLPGFHNHPILKTDERHQVGICYKERGQDAAVQLGMERVGPSRQSRLQTWIDCIRRSTSQSGVVMCWRGGLRSQIAQSWLQAEGQQVLRIEGGYKSMRQLLIKSLDACPSFFVLTGLTGSGKTDLLKLFPHASLDLEGLARHRGSSFGLEIGDQQPTQVEFENTLALQLLILNRDRILVEDESAVIGAVALPRAVREGIARAPVICLEAELSARSYRLFLGYVSAPQERLKDPTRLCTHLLLSLSHIKKKLGGQLYHSLAKEITRAFESSERLQFATHRAWIEQLLVEHYDRLYNYSAQRLKRPILFSGSFEECRQWLKHTYG